MTDERDSGDQGLGPVSRGIVLLSLLGHRPHSIGDLHGATGLPKATIHRLLAQTHRHPGRRPGPEHRNLHARPGGPATGAHAARRPELEHRLVRAAGPAPAAGRHPRDRGPAHQHRPRTAVHRRGTEHGPDPLHRRGRPHGPHLHRLRRQDPAASLAPAEAERILAVATDDPETIRRVSREVAEARERGWAESAGERVPGAAAVSVPVRVDDAGGYADDDAGSYIASLSVLGPADRLPPGRRRELAVVLQETAERIGRGSAHKAHPPPSPPPQNIER